LEHLMFDLVTNYDVLLQQYRSYSHFIGIS